MADISKVRMLNGTEYNYKDAKARSDIEGLKADLEHIGLSDAVKIALLNCFKHVSWDHTTDTQYLDDLESALYEDAYPRILASFNPTNTIYTDDPLDDIKQYLTVKYYEQHGDSGTVIQSENYSLSGILAEGENIVHVTYDDYKTIVIVDAVDFYAIKNWVAGDNLFTLAAGTVAGQNKAGVETMQIGNYIPNIPRMSMVVHRGKTPVINASGDPYSGVYPFPVPSDCTKIVFETDDTKDYYYGVGIWTLDESTGVYTRIYNWPWSKSFTKDFTAGANYFATINIKNGTAGTAAITPESYDSYVRIVFS